MRSSPLPPHGAEITEAEFYGQLDLEKLMPCRGQCDQLELICSDGTSGEDVSKFVQPLILREYPTSSISGNNVQKCLLESDFLANCSGIPPLKLLYFRKVRGYPTTIVFNLLKIIYSKHFRILFPEILVVGYPIYVYCIIYLLAAVLNNYTLIIYSIR